MSRNVALVALYVVSVALFMAMCEGQNRRLVPAQALATEKTFAPYCTRRDDKLGYRGCFAIAEFADSNNTYVGLVLGMKQEAVLYVITRPGGDHTKIITPGYGLTPRTSVVAVYAVADPKASELIERFKTQPINN